MNPSEQIAREYFKKRLKQMGPLWSISRFDPVVIGGRLMWGLKCVFVLKTHFGPQHYQSIWVFEEYRNRGLMTRYVREQRLSIPFVTMPECDINQWFEKHQIPYLMVT